MNYYLGIDGGGSKTALLCLDRTGNAVGQARVGATYYRQDGVDGVIRTLREGIDLCLPAGEQAAVCFGMPGYGDSPKEDQEAADEIAAAFPQLRFRFVNDVVAGWAGALALSPGVSLVAGTGSIAYGQDSAGHTARCGGWHAFFSDEGSGYWLGRELLQLFSMESDGRLKRTALYHITKERLGLAQDEDVNALADTRYSHSRMELASLQRVLLEAAQMGDEYALAAYRKAAEHLAEIVLGAVRQLDFPEGRVSVSCSGGLTHIEVQLMNYMRKRLQERLRPLAMDYQTPKLTACEGAVLLAAESFFPEDVADLRDKLLTKAR